MIKKSYFAFIIILISHLLLISCDCPYCDEYDIYGFKENKYGIHYSNDSFCYEKLLGTWQMDYGCIVGNIELKEIKFIDGIRCDITMAQVRNIDWFTETWTYTYYGNTIKFARNDGRTVISFAIKGYIWPELYLQDSFGNYTWRKVRSYGC
jgi:hypothetical protein